MQIINKRSCSLCIVLLLAVSSCKKFVEIDAPRTELIRSVVFTGDATANAAVIDIYYQLMQSIGFASGGTNSITLLASLSADEIVNGSTNDNELQQINTNSILPANKMVLAVWSDLYKCIYKANAVLEGLAASPGVTESMKKQLEGESKFLRAFCFFYLVNLWGDVPLVLTTDYRQNQKMIQASQADIYTRMIADLKDAQLLLGSDFSFSNNERIRVNKGTATALLARVYLYTGDWMDAELQSSEVINNTDQYSLVPLNDVFLQNNSEAIWQLTPNYNVPEEYVIFYYYGHKIRTPLLNAFEPGDTRKTTWLELAPAGYYRPSKYRSVVTYAEYTVLFRLAEQYLIRAEARLKQGKITGANSAESDINTIRARAGLGNTTADTESAMQAAIEQERRVELFTEWGHRWFDLKRWNKADAVLGPVKAPNWQPTDKLYPIPEYQVLNSPVTQHPGY